MTDTREKIKNLKEFPITAVLAHFGKRTDHERYMYYSPFRDEKIPSMKIDKEKNLWHDKGENIGGSVIDMVIRLQNGYYSGPLPASKEDFNRAIELLSGLDPSAVPIETKNYHGNDTAGSIVIDKTFEKFTKEILIEYSRNRGIPQETLEKYCKQIKYHIEYDNGKSKSYHAIAFFNDKGGCAIRWASQDPKKGKMTCHPAVTTLGPDGTHSEGPSHGDCLVFEGFFDMMSWLVWAGRKTPGCDVVVLNSVSMLRHAEDWIRQHTRIGVLTDNDKAGDKTCEKIKEYMKDSPGILEVRDLRTIYKNFNDFNDFLKSNTITI